jgi:hypothetical protein
VIFGHQKTTNLSYARHQVFLKIFNIWLNIKMSLSQLDINKKKNHDEKTKKLVEDNLLDFSLGVSYLTMLKILKRIKNF